MLLLVVLLENYWEMPKQKKWTNFLKNWTTNNRNKHKLVFGINLIFYFKNILTLLFSFLKFFYLLESCIFHMAATHVLVVDMTDWPIHPRIKKRIKLGCELAIQNWNRSFYIAWDLRCIYFSSLMVTKNLKYHQYLRERFRWHFEKEKKSANLVFSEKTWQRKASTKIHILEEFEVWEDSGHDFCYYYYYYSDLHAFSPLPPSSNY